MPHTFTIDCDQGEDMYTFLDASVIEATWHDVGAGKTSWRDGKGNAWYGGLGPSACLARTHTGDAGLVERSDTSLALLEDLIVRTRKFRNIDDVVGSLPNVPAFLAGHPCAMRRRIRVDCDDAPVSIFMDLTASAGIDARDMLARGIAILAFTRLLVEHRAVELWAGIALGEGSYARRAWSSTVAWRIDTAPLDLARSAHLISHPAMARGVGYGLAQALARRTWNGSWSFGDHAKHVATQHERLRRAFGSRELLLVPPIHLHDELTTDPIAWIKRELARYTGQHTEDAAA